MKNRDFVITTLQVWDIEIGSTIKNTALEFSKQNRVLYVNTPMDHSTWLRGGTKVTYTQRMDVVRGRKPYLRQINDNMWVVDCPFMIYSINKIKSAWLFDYFNKKNNRKIARFISKVTKELGFTDIINFIDTDIYRSQYMKEYLAPDLSVYFRRDYVIGEAYWRQHGPRLEPMICTKSDVVLTNSLYYANQSSIYNPNTVDVGAGVNLELYDYNKKFDEPEDIKNIPHPRVGYIGTVNSTRLDGELLLNMARQRPEYSFVFTGPQDATFAHHEIHKLSNVYFLGSKTMEQLPAYLLAYDVCMNPQMTNINTEGNYPLKIDEYLAMGRPTIATRTFTMEHLFIDHVFLANGEQEYLTILDAAMAEVGDKAKEQAKVAFAHTHSWENNVKRIYRAIEETINKR